MKKTLITMLILGTFLLASCNFPLSNPTPTPDAVATEVAYMLTATTQGMQQMAQVQATPAETATIEFPATLTPEPTATTAPSPTPQDFTSTLGDPYWSSDLSSGAAFGITGDAIDDGNTSFSVSNGMMNMVAKYTNGWKGWRLTNRTISNYYLEGTFITGTCSGTDQYGLVFRAPDYGSGYGFYLGITCDGKYFLNRWDSSGNAGIISATSSADLKSGSGQTNRVGVYANGSSIKIYINGKYQQEWTDSSLQTGPVIGVWIASGNTANFTVQVDSMTMWNSQ